MAISLNWPPGAFVCDENGKPLSEPDPETMRNQLRDALAFQEQCKADAKEFLQFYFNKEKAIQIQDMADWLEAKGPIDRWFLVHLIEVAGQKFLDRSWSAHKAEIARAKNAPARAWVRDQWANRADKDQGKAAFGREFTHLVKRAFGASITPETITRDWLKGQ